MRIEWTPKATKTLRRLPANLRERIIAKVEDYAADPSTQANNVIRMKGAADLMRLRVGDWRVIFRVDAGAATIMVVLHVRPRGGAYD